MTAAAPLDITVTDDGLALAGELDAHTAPLLAEAIAAADADRLSIDMSQVRFVDSSGLRVLIEAHQSALAQDRTVCLTNPSPTVTRLLQISGIDDYLVVES